MINHAINRVKYFNRLTAYIVFIYQSVFAVVDVLVALLLEGVPPHKAAPLTPLVCVASVSASPRGKLAGESAETEATQTSGVSGAAGATSSVQARVSAA